MKKIQSIEDLETLSQQERELWFARILEIPAIAFESQDPISVIKKAMIDRGYHYHIKCEAGHCYTTFNVYIGPNQISGYSGKGTNEEQSVWRSMAKSLLAEIAREH